MGAHKGPEQPTLGKTLREFIDDIRHKETPIEALEAIEQEIREARRGGYYELGILIRCIKEGQPIEKIKEALTAVRNVTNPQNISREQGHQITKIVRSYRPEVFVDETNSQDAEGVVADLSSTESPEVGEFSLSMNETVDPKIKPEDALRFQFREEIEKAESLDKIARILRDGLDDDPLGTLRKRIQQITEIQTLVQDRKFRRELYELIQELPVEGGLQDAVMRIVGKEMYFIPEADSLEGLELQQNSPAVQRVFNPDKRFDNTERPPIQALDRTPDPDLEKSIENSTSPTEVAKWLRDAQEGESFVGWLRRTDPKDEKSETVVNAQIHEKLSAIGSVDERVDNYNEEVTELDPMTPPRNTRPVANENVSTPQVPTVHETPDHYNPDLNQVMNGVVQKDSQAERSLRIEIKDVSLLERIAQVPGFNEMKPSQQALVYRNVEQFHERKGNVFLRNVWSGILSKMPGAEKRAQTQESEERAAVEAAIQFVRDNNLSAHVTESGEILTKLVPINQGDIPREKRPLVQGSIDALNKAAHDLASVPDDWKTDGTGTHANRFGGTFGKIFDALKDDFSPARKRYIKYREKEAAYNEKKKAFIQSLLDAGIKEKEPGEFVKKLIQIDAQTTMTQYFNNSDKEVTQIQQTADMTRMQSIGQSLLSKAGEAKKYSLYAGIGFVGRRATAEYLSFLAAPGVSAIVGGWREWNKTAAERRDKDRLERLGVVATDALSLNLIQAGTYKDAQGRESPGAIARMEERIAKARQLTKKNVSSSDEEVVKILRSLEARARHMEDKIRLNRVIFGTGAEKYINIARYFEVLGEARTLLVQQNFVADKNDPFFKSIENAGQNAESNKEKARQDEKINASGKGAVIALVFGTAGALLAEMLRVNADALERVQEKIGTVATKVKETVSGWFTNESRVPPGAEAGSVIVPEDSIVLDRKVPTFETEAAPLVLTDIRPVADIRPALENNFDAEAEPETAMVEQAPIPDVTVKAGDTLSSILRNHYPGIQDFPRAEQDRFITLALDRLSPHQIGKIMSGNMPVGSKVNVQAFVDFTNMPNQPQAESAIGRRRPGT